MTRPPLPTTLFNMSPTTRPEIRRLIRKKRNKATPGFNGLGYLIYKKCDSIIIIIHKIFVKIWKSRDIPSDWGLGLIILLSKSDILDNPAEFRPIALGSTLAKIFFSGLSNRLHDYFVNNNMIKRNIQKGFIRQVCGCLDHTFSLWETLKHAKNSKRSIVTAWIDLANAYGSVRHNLIQFALEWYHVPEGIRQLIFNYYEVLRAQVHTKEWSTSVFTYDIGVFQGCPLSAILFNIVFNLLLDFLAPLSHLAYTFTLSPKPHNIPTQPFTHVPCNDHTTTTTTTSNIVHTFTKAFADDLNLTTTTAKDNQLLLDRTDIWLSWSDTMKAKPRKCVSLAFRQFRKGCKSRDGLSLIHI